MIHVCKPPRIAVFVLLSIQLLAHHAWCGISFFQDTLYFYVSPEGSDSWSGRMNQMMAGETDGPFASPFCATEAVNNVRMAGIEGPVVVQFSEGIYQLDSSWLISSQLSGTTSGETIFRAAAGAKVSIIGGMIVPQGWLTSPPTDLEGLDPFIRDSLRYIDLSRFDIAEIGALENRGFPRPDFPSPMELFVDYKPLQMARWPNEGWVRISGTNKGRFSGQFTYSSEHVDQWSDNIPFWLHGFWARDWADSYELVRQVDTSANVIYTQEPHGTYGYEKGQRFYAINLLQELDRPGEWYLDTEHRFILYWPLPNSDDAQVMLSRLTSPLLQVNAAHHLRFDGLIFEGGRGHAAELTDAAHVQFFGCTFRNTGRLAIAIRDGSSNMVDNCQIYATGEGGILVSGGERDSLISAGHRIFNNEIHHTNRWVITYSPGIQVEGVGILISHNLLHHIPHMAIRLLGNDHIIEYNEFTQIGSETGDAGAVYIGKDWSMRGNVIRYNYFHDINSPYHRGMMGVYLDDLVGGMYIHHNIFQNVQRAVVVGGGRNNVVADNIFLNCRNSALRVEYRQGTASNASTQLRKRLESVPYQSKTWLKKYPELNTLLEDEPLAPKDNKIHDNVVLKGKWMEITPKAAKLQQMKNNRLIEDFSEYKVINDSLELLFNNSELQLPDIPWQKIGLQE